MPPPSPFFYKKEDENQVSYFIWPKNKNYICSAMLSSSYLYTHHSIMQCEAQAWMWYLPASSNWARSIHQARAELIFMRLSMLE